MLSFLLLFSHSALAAPKEIWRLSLGQLSPKAVFFDAASGNLFVSANRGDQAILVTVSQAGKLLSNSVAKAEGEAGALRAFDGKIYWLTGQDLQVVGGESLKKWHEESGRPADIALDAEGNAFVGFTSGSLWKLSAVSAEKILQGPPISGLFLLTGHLFGWRAGRLAEFQQRRGGKTADLGKNFCPAECQGLERSSEGGWLSTNGRGQLLVFAGGKVRQLLQEAKLGHLAYVYCQDSADDFVVLPFPATHEIRAYRYRALEKSVVP